MFVKGEFREDQIQLSSTDFSLTIPDMKHWVAIQLSYVGASKSGWLESDQPNWDEAISIIVDQSEKAPRYQKLEPGAVKLSFSA